MKKWYIGFLGRLPIEVEVIKHSHFYCTVPDQRILITEDIYGTEEEARSAVITEAKREIRRLGKVIKTHASNT